MPRYSKINATIMQQQRYSPDAERLANLRLNSASPDNIARHPENMTANQDASDRREYARTHSTQASRLFPTADGVHVKTGDTWFLLKWEDLQAFLCVPSNTDFLPENDIVRKTAVLLQERMRRNQVSATTESGPDERHCHQERKPKNKRTGPYGGRMHRSSAFEHSD